MTTQAQILNQAIWTGFTNAIFPYVFFAIVISIIVNAIPHRRQSKRNKDPGLLDGLAYLARLLIGYLTSKGNDGDWLSDQQILAQLRGMSPNEFEKLIAEMFKTLGYRTRVVGGSGDGGIDIEMIKDGRNHLVQCKKFITRKVTPHDVRDFFGAMGDRRADGKGFFITTNIFTLEAERFAEGKPIELVDGTRLVGLVRESGVLGSSETKPTDICPTCGGKLVERTNKRTGQTFLGCSNFPKCRYTKTS